jgi:hypothetical protein
MLTTRTKIWLKTYGRLVEDDLWRMPVRYATERFMVVLNWELAPELWSRSKDKSITILLDWDGDIVSLDPERVMNEMDIIGQSIGYDGWAPLKRLSDQEEVYLMYKIPNYQTMIAT